MSFYRRVHRYAFDGEVKLLKDLLRKFPDRVCEKDVLMERNVLHYCGIKGRTRIAKYILGRFKEYELLTAKDRHGFTCVHYCCLNGHSRLLSLFLLQELVDIDDNKNKEKVTPLHLCVENDRTKCFKLLLQYGANPKIENNDGETVEDLCQNNPRMKLAYESYLDGLFDIWESESQFSVKGGSEERKQKQNAYPFFRFRLCIDLNSPGVRLVIKRLLSLNEGDGHFVSVCSNFLTRTHESKWRSSLKGMMCFPTKDERLDFLTSMFHKRLKKRDELHFSDFYVHLCLLSFCHAKVEYPFQFLLKVLQIGKENKLRLILNELKEMNVCEVDFHTETIQFSEANLFALRKKKASVLPFLTSLYETNEEGLNKLFSSAKEEEVPQAIVAPSKKLKKKNRKQRKNTMKKEKKNKTKVSGVTRLPSMINFSNLEEVMGHNDFLSQIALSRGYRVALIIGNSRYQSKNLSEDNNPSSSSSSHPSNNHSFSTISPELIQNDCTAISFMLKNKFGFHVTQKKDLTGREVNLEVFRTLSICKSLAGRKSGKPVILFIYFSGHFEEGRFLGTDFEESFDGNFIHIKRLVCEIEESQVNDFDFCYLLTNPISRLGDPCRSVRDTKFMIGVPFQGFLGSTTSMTPSFDGSFSKFSKLFCRFLDTGRLDITQIFRKVRKKGIGVQFQSNFGKYNTGELILNPCQSNDDEETIPKGVEEQVRDELENPGEMASQEEDDEGGSVTLPIPGGKANEVVIPFLEKLERKIRELKKRKKKIGFIIYHSKFSPPYKFEEVMMERFKAAIKKDFSCSRLKFDDGDEDDCYDELLTPTKNTTRKRAITTMKTPKPIERIAMKPLLTPKSSSKKARHRSPIRSSSSSNKPQFLSPIRSPLQTRMRAHSEAVRKKSVQKVRTRHASLNDRVDVVERRSENELFGEPTLLEDVDEELKICTVLKSVWVDIPDSVYTSRIQRTKDIERLMNRLKSSENEILALKDCIEPTPVLLHVFRFLYLLFISPMESQRNLLSRMDDEKVDEAEEEEEEQEPKEEVEGEEDKEEEEIDLKKQMQAAKLWETYAKHVWTKEFLQVLYDYDFQIDCVGTLDQMEEINEKLKLLGQQLEETGGGVEKLLTEMVGTWLKFFELKYINSDGTVHKKEDREEYLKIISGCNSGILRSFCGRNSRGNNTVSNKAIVNIHPLKMVENVKEALSAQINGLKSGEMFLFLGVTDEQFLAGCYDFISSDLPLLIGCTSSEQKELVNKKLGESKCYVKASSRILVVDVLEDHADDGYVDKTEVIEEVGMMMKKFKEKENQVVKKLFGKSKTRK